MGVLLGATIAIGVLRNPVVNVIALPLMLYAFVSLAGVREWQRIGVAPRCPRGRVAVGPAVFVLVVVPLAWGRRRVPGPGRPPLGTAGVIIAVIVAAGRVGLSRLHRRDLLGR